MRNIYAVIFLTIFACGITQHVKAQHSFISARQWAMPAGHSNGLVTPGFRLAPTFKLEHLGDETNLILEFDVTLSSPSNTPAPYSYRYMYMGKEYTDQDLGPGSFQSIRLNTADFKVLVQGPNINTTITYQTFLGRKKIARVPKDTRPDAFAAHVQGLLNVDYYGTENIERAIQNLQASIKKKQDDEKRLAEEKLAAERQRAREAEAAKKKQEEERLAKQNQAAQERKSGAQASASSKSSDNFWSDKADTKPASSNVIPDQASHKRLPDFVRTTDGGYFHRGADGRFREVTQDEYMQAKKAASASRPGQPEPEQPKMTAEQVRAQINQRFADYQAQNEAINRNIEQKFEVMRQNYYHAEAIRTGKQNLAGLSRLDGNYNSVAELESEFNQKFYSIQTEVNNMQYARNAQLSNAVGATFNGNSTEQAIGQGIQLVGGLINSAQAKKEAQAAEAALKAERERQLAAIAAAKRKAMLELRNKLVTSFPQGGTPITSHKITQPEVYIFAYITNKAAFNNDKATVSVSNVFPVEQYSDGTYPYKTTVLSKLKGYAPGEVTLVGYYTGKEMAEQMRTSFINLASKSNLAVKAFGVKGTGTSSVTGTIAQPADFWETGKKATVGDKSAAPASTEKKSDFWNN